MGREVNGNLSELLGNLPVAAAPEETSCVHPVTISTMKTPLSTTLEFVLLITYVFFYCIFNKLLENTCTWEHCFKVVSFIKQKSLLQHTASEPNDHTHDSSYKICQQW